MAKYVTNLMSELKRWQWETALAGAIAGFATVAFLHPLDVVRTRFQVNNGQESRIPVYKNTVHAIFTVARNEKFKGMYAGLSPAVTGSAVSWGLYFFFYNTAKQRYSKTSGDQLTPALHLASAAEAGVLVSLSTNPFWLVKTRLQLQTPFHHSKPYYGFYDAIRTIWKEEGWTAFYKGIVPGLFLVSHGAIQFTVYEQLQKVFNKFRRGEMNSQTCSCDGKHLNSMDYAALGGISKMSAILATYPFQVVRARLQQRPEQNRGIGMMYRSTWHVVRETCRKEGMRGFYRGITSSMLKNVPASSLMFVVYENVLRLLPSPHSQPLLLP